MQFASWFKTHRHLPFNPRPISNDTPFLDSRAFIPAVEKTAASGSGQTLSVPSVKWRDSGGFFGELAISAPSRYSPAKTGACIAISESPTTPRKTFRQFDGRPADGNSPPARLKFFFNGQLMRANELKYPSSVGNAQSSACVVQFVNTNYCYLQAGNGRWIPSVEAGGTLNGLDTLDGCWLCRRLRLRSRSDGADVAVFPAAAKETHDVRLGLPLGSAIELLASAKSEC